jgi:hypothetical protein
VLALLALFVVLYGVANPLIFDWYWPSLNGAWLLVWFAGGLGWLHRSGAAWKWVAPALLALWWLGTAGSDGRDVARISKDVRPSEALSLGRNRDPAMRRIDTYREVAHWLDANTQGAVVASAEIGALGFYYSGAILDTCGLVSPAAVAFHPLPLERRGAAEISAIPRELVRSELPDYLVTMPVFAFKSLFGWDWFTRHYRVVKTFPLNLPPGLQLWGGREIAVYRLTGTAVGGDGSAGSSPAAAR